jgi:hypothetical protein
MARPKPELTLEDLRRCARSERHSREAVFRMKWPRGFRCSNCPCRSHRFLPKRPKVVECVRCHHQETLTSGTFFQGTRKDLRLWFRALLFVLSAKRPVTTTRLKQHLGLPTYQTAWTWLRKIQTLIEGTSWAQRLRQRFAAKLGPSTARELWDDRHRCFQAWAIPLAKESSNPGRSARSILPILLAALPPLLRLQPFPMIGRTRARGCGTLSLKYLPGYFLGWLFPCAFTLKEALPMLLRTMAAHPSEAGWRLVGRKSAHTPLLVSPP